MNLIDELIKFKDGLNYGNYLKAKKKAGAEYSEKDAELRAKMKETHRQLMAAKAHKDYSLTTIIDNLRDIVNESYNEGYYKDRDYAHFLENTGADLNKDIDNLNKIIGAKVTEEDIDNYNSLTIPQRAELMDKFGYDYNSKKARAEFFDKIANREREEELKKIWNTDLTNSKNPIDFFQNFSLSYGPQSLAKDYAKNNYDEINTDEGRYNPLNNPELFGLAALGTAANTAETLSFDNSGKAINAGAKYVTNKAPKIAESKAGKIAKTVDNYLQKPMNNKYASESLDIMAAPTLYGVGDYAIYGDAKGAGEQTLGGYGINAAAAPLINKVVGGLLRKSGSTALNDFADYLQKEPYGKLKEAKSKAAEDVKKVIKGEDQNLFGDEYQYIKEQINKKAGREYDNPKWEYIEPESSQRVGKLTAKEGQGLTPEEIEYAKWVQSLSPEELEKAIHKDKFVSYSEDLDKYKGRMPEMITVPEHKKSKEFLEAFDVKEPNDYINNAYKIEAYDPNLLGEYNSYMRTGGNGSAGQMILSDLYNYARNYGTNKAGRNQWATAIPMAGEAFKKVYEDINNTKAQQEKEKVKERHNIGKFDIDENNLTTEEKKIVQMIKDNPELLKGLGKAQDVARVSNFLIYHPGIIMEK